MEPKDKTKGKRKRKGVTRLDKPLVVRMAEEFGEDFEEAYFLSIGW